MDIGSGNCAFAIVCCGGAGRSRTQDGQGQVQLRAGNENCGELPQAGVGAGSRRLWKKLAAQQAEKGAAAQKEGEAFLAANKAKEGVVTLASGLQYKILKAGTGEKPTLDDTVMCNYKGTLVNGTEFDASEKHGGPATFPVKGVIAGWTEALQLMPAGSKWQLFVPSNLAYGPQGPGDIGPNATLIFEVELVSIQKSAASGAAASK
jgi:FKBP-type peptidyl-prolyl cis-trans isomerase